MLNPKKIYARLCDITITYALLLVFPNLVSSRIASQHPNMLANMLATGTDRKFWEIQ